MSSKKNNIIILNGPSSSGKTTTLNYLQKHSKDIWLSWGVDPLWNNILHSSNFCYDIDSYKADLNKLFFGFKVKKQKDKVLREQLMFENGKKIMTHMSECINILAKSYNVVVGDVIYPYTSDPNYALNCYTNHLDLENNRVFLMGIDCEEKEIARREKLRNSHMSGEIQESEQSEARPEGLALQQKAIVHQNKIYDLMLDSTNLSIVELTEIILNFVENNEPSALKLTRDMINNNQIITGTKILNHI